MHQCLPQGIASKNYIEEKNEHEQKAFVKNLLQKKKKFPSKNQTGMKTRAFSLCAPKSTAGYKMQLQNLTFSVLFNTDFVLGGFLFLFFLFVFCYLFFVFS